MGKKVVYKLGYNVNNNNNNNNNGTGVATDSNDHHRNGGENVNNASNLPKRTRTLLLQYQVAEEEKDYAKMDACLETLGDLYMDADDLARTIDVAKKELKLADVVKDQKQAIVIRTRALYRLCRSYRSLEQFDAAITHNKKYISNAQYLQDRSEELEGHMELALTYIARWESDDQQPTDLNDAFLALRAGSALLKHLPTKEMRESVKAALNINIGIALNHGGEPDRALFHIAKALEFYRSEGNRPFEAKAYLNMALSYQGKKDVDQCLKYLQKERMIWHELGDAGEEARVWWDLAIRCREFHRYTDAIAALKAYVSLCADMDDDEGRRKGNAEIREANDCIEKQNTINQLTDNYTQLRKLAGSNNNADTAITTNSRRVFDLLADRGKLYLDLGQTAEALKDFNEQKRMAYTMKLPKRRVEEILHNLGDALTGEERYADAIRTYREALDKFEGPDETRLELLLRLGDAYLKNTTSTESYETLSRTFDEAYVLARKLADLEAQRDALKQLHSVNLQHHYEAKARNYADKLDQVEILMRAASAGETPGTSQLDQDSMSVGSYTGEESAEHAPAAPYPDANLSESSTSPLPARRKRPTTQRDENGVRPGPIEFSSPTTRPGLLLRPKENVPPMRQDFTSDALEVPLTSRAKDKGSKYRIHTISTDLDVSPFPPPMSWQPTTTTPSTSCANPKKLASSSSSTAPAPTVLSLLSSPLPATSPPPQVDLTANTSARKRNVARKRLRIESSPDPPVGRAEMPNTPSRTGGIVYQRQPAPSTPRLRRAGVSRETSPSPLPRQHSLLAITDISSHSATSSPIPTTTTTTAPRPSTRIRGCRTPTHPNHQQPTPTSNQSHVPVTPTRSTQRRKKHHHHHQQAPPQPRPPFKVRVVIDNPREEKEIFAIACPDGPRGTPKTVGWLVDEAKRRFNDIYKIKPPILKVVTTDPDTNELETLGCDDILTDVLTHKQKVTCVLRKEDGAA
ncbi:hypothetical protein PhCBS80983_g03363 [Powellomyces hirtus]|uniref:Uncharacterized protein n=1 Tax=Powellomyces hirtus TaxID=109895 RepID=A0A507E2Z1_9FUNG|nr:hypothetical protein PhCBS80983_g03363 [Powellomyces hirtus]